MLARNLSKRWTLATLTPSRRNNTSLAALPPVEDWKTVFHPLVNTNRYFLKDQSTGDQLAKAFIDNERVCQQPKVIIEAFPGPGVLTRGLLKLPPSQVKKIIVLEESENYLKYLKPLEECDPRVSVVPRSGFHWSTYRELDALGHFKDVTSNSWEGEPSNVHFVSHIQNSVHGDQLVSQLMRLVPEGNWLFKHGRVTLSLILHKALLDRTVATPRSKAYCKHSVVARGVCSMEELTPDNDPPLFSEKFFPTFKNQETKRGKQHTSWGPYCALNLYPLAEPTISRELSDKWDYCLRRLFVLKSTPLKKAINSLAPGASNMLPAIKKSNVDINKQIRELDLNDFAAIIKAFDEWPFAPADLLITDTLREVDREK